MLEGLLYQLLVSYLGDYAKDINREQVKVGLWSGVVLLENVELRLEAFDFLQLPVSIKQAIVGKLKLQVPWTKLGWDPILIVLEDVRVLACPRDESEYNAEELECRAWAAKKAKLAAAKFTKFSNRVPDEKVRQSFLSHLYAKVIDNIQIKVGDIHIRYIDAVTNPGNPFAAGLTLSGLSFLNTVEPHGQSPGSGASTGAKSTTLMVHKLVEIHQLGFYWSSVAYKEGKQFADNEGFKCWSVDRESYLLCPLDASLKFTVNRDGVIEAGAPDYAISIKIENMEFNMNNHQLHEMLLLLDCITICRIRERYGQFRPTIGRFREGHNWQRKWWQYAINATLHDVEERLRQTSWKYLGWRLERRRQYVTLYKGKLECILQGKQVDDGTIEMLETIEKEVDVNMILQYRTLAENKLVYKDTSMLEARVNGLLTKDNMQNQKSAEEILQPQPQRGWLNRFSFGMLGTSDSNSIDAAEFTSVLSDEIIKDLYKATEFDPSLLVGNAWSKVYNTISVTLQVQQAICKLRSLNETGSIVQMTIKTVGLNYQQYQDTKQLLIVAKDLEVTDVQMTKTAFPHICGSKAIFSNYAGSCLKRKSYAEAVSSSNGIPSLMQSVLDVGFNMPDIKDAILWIEVKLFSEKEATETSINVNVNPLGLLYSPPVVKLVLDFLRLPTLTMSRVDSTSLGGSRRGDAGNHHKCVKLCIRIKELVIIMPEATTSSNCAVLVVSLESLGLTFLDVYGGEQSRLSNEWMDGNLLEGGTLGDGDNDKFMKSLELKFTGGQAMLHDKVATRYLVMHIVEKFNFHGRMIVASSMNDASSIEVKVYGRLPAFQLSLSSAICRPLFIIFANVHQRSESAIPNRVNDITKFSLERRMLFSVHIILESIVVKFKMDRICPTLEKTLVIEIDDVNIRLNRTIMVEDARFEGRNILLSVKEPVEYSLLHLTGISTRTAFNEPVSYSLAVILSRTLVDGKINLNVVVPQAECHIYPEIFAMVKAEYLFLFMEDKMHPHLDVVTKGNTTKSSQFGDCTFLVDIYDAAFILHDENIAMARILFPHCCFLMCSPDVPNISWEIKGHAHGPQLIGLAGSRKEVFFDSLHDDRPCKILVQVDTEGNENVRSTNIYLKLGDVLCKLESEFLCHLIRFFVSPKWKSYDQLGNQPTETSISYKIDIESSCLLFPIKEMAEFVELRVPEFSFSYASGPYGMRSTSEKLDGLTRSSKLFYMLGSYLSLSTHSHLHKNPLPGHYEGDHHLNSSLPLIERLDGELSIEIECSMLASSEGNQVIKKTCIQLAVPILDAVLADNVFLQQAKCIEDVSCGLSSISISEKTVETSAILAENSGSNHIILDVLAQSIRCFIRPLRVSQANISICTMESLTCCSRITDGCVDTLIVELQQLSLLCPIAEGGLLQFYERNKASVSVVDVCSSTNCPMGQYLEVLRCESIKQNKMIRLDYLPSPLDGSEFKIIFPQVKIWLLIAPWNKIISWLLSWLPDLIYPEETGLRTNVDGTGTLEAIEQSFLSKHNIHNLESVHTLRESWISELSSLSGNDALLITIGMPNISLLLPDFVLPSELLSRKMDGQTDTYDKFILFSLSFFLDKLYVSDTHSVLCGHFGQVQAEIHEGVLDQHSSTPILVAHEVGFWADINFCNMSEVQVVFLMQADSLDLWCSHKIMKFLTSFSIEPFESQEKVDLDLQITFDVQLQSYSILLTDGRWNCNAPLVEILMNMTSLQLAWKTLDLELRFSSRLEINYHNIQKVAWEPLLEPWAFMFSLRHGYSIDPSSGKQYFTKLDASSSSKSNINITEALLQAIFRAVEMVQDVWTNISSCPEDRMRNSSMGSSERYAPYWLQNDTGIAISYWFLGTCKNDEDSKDGDLMRRPCLSRSSHLMSKIILPGGSVPLFVEENEGVFHRKSSRWSSSSSFGMKKTASLAHRKISVQLEGTCEPSPPISVDLVGSRAFDVTFSRSINTLEGEGLHNEANLMSGKAIPQKGADVGYTTYVVLEVSVQHYSKLIRVHSMVEVLNATTIPLEMRFDIPFGIAPKVLGPILPGEVFPLPVHLAQTGKIRWRPSKQSYLWSEAQLLSKMVVSEQLDHYRPIVCYPSHPSNSAFRSCIAVRKVSIPAASSTHLANLDHLTRGHGKDRLVSDAVYQSKLHDELDNHALGVQQCNTWKILLEAPLVIKNCLPRPLTIGMGSIFSVIVPEGEVASVYEVDIMHDLSLTISIPDFTPCLLNFGRVSLASPEAGESMNKVSSEDCLVLRPKVPSDFDIYLRVEKCVDILSGARDLCIYVPFWLYNCSNLNLTLVHGESDLQQQCRRILLDNLWDDKPNIFGSKSMMISETPGLQCVIEEEVKSQASSRCPGIVLSHLPSCKVICNEHTKKRQFKAHESNNLLDVTPSIHSSLQKKDGISKGAVPGPQMFSPAKYLETSDTKMKLGICYSWPKRTIWSHPFLLDLPSETSTIIVPEAGSKGAFVLSVSSAAILGTCMGKTKAVRFRPRFVLANACNEDLCFKQQGTNVFQLLPVGECCDFHWADVSRKLLLSIRFDQHGWDWSGAFEPDRLGDTQVKLYNHFTGAGKTVRAEVSNTFESFFLEENSVGTGNREFGTLLIILTNDETGFMPYRIDNYSMERLRFYQQRCEKSENILQPYSSCEYAWDEPCLPPRLVIEIPGEGVLGSFRLDEVKEYPAIHLNASPKKTERKLIVSVHAEGAKRVLSLSDAGMHMEGSYSHVIYGLDEPCSVIKRRASISKEIIINLSFVGVSIIDSSPKEVIFMSARALSIHYLEDALRQNLEVKVARVQVDNQLYRALYPVMLSAADVTTADLPLIAEINQNDLLNTHAHNFEKQACDMMDKPALAVVVAKWRHGPPSVDCYHRIHLRFAPLQVELEERNVKSLLEFIKSLSAGGLLTEIGYGEAFEPENKNMAYNVRFAKVVKSSVINKCYDVAEAIVPIRNRNWKLALHTNEKKKVYFEVLDIEPVELTVSFSSAPWMPNGNDVAEQSIFWMTGTLLQRRLLALADVEGAPVSLKGLTLTHPMASPDAIRGMILRHYTRQLLHATYKVLGSADVFGNPMSFMKSLSSGVRDFVSAPAESFIQSPSYVLKGIARGTKSLFQNTIYAFSNAAARMSKAAHKGVAMFVFEQDYAELERRKQEGSTQDGSIVNEFLEGLTGLLESPIRGAEQHGIPGAISGIAIGVLGAVARPVGSLLELAGKTAQSIRNRSRLAHIHTLRVRVPRHIDKDLPLIPYSWGEAVGETVLVEADGGRLKNEVYITCQPLSVNGTFILLTENLLLKVCSASLGGKVLAFGPEWSIEWEHVIEDLLHIDQYGCSFTVLFSVSRIRCKNKHTLHNWENEFLRPFGSRTFESPSIEYANELYFTLTSLMDQQRLKKKHVLSRTNLAHL